MSVASAFSDGGSHAAQSDGNFLTALTDFAALVQSKTLEMCQPNGDLFRPAPSAQRDEQAWDTGAHAAAGKGAVGYDEASDGGRSEVEPAGQWHMDWWRAASSAFPAKQQARTPSGALDRFVSVDSQFFVEEEDRNSYFEDEGSHLERQSSRGGGIEEEQELGPWEERTGEKIVGYTTIGGPRRRQGGSVAGESEVSPRLRARIQQYAFEQMSVMSEASRSVVAAKPMGEEDFKRLATRDGNVELPQCLDDPDFDPQNPLHLRTFEAEYQELLTQAQEDLEDEAMRFPDYVQSARASTAVSSQRMTNRTLVVNTEKKALFRALFNESTNKWIKVERQKVRGIAPDYKAVFLQRDKHFLRRTMATAGLASQAERQRTVDLKDRASAQLHRGGPDLDLIPVGGLN
mmetsp:Transcript_55698/g.132273  ORF Transcript_55698/g.132273 Transcript_55698/m.132273 type:complete len:403 (-) Transcript_55698:40-1248(-)